MPLPSLRDEDAPGIELTPVIDIVFMLLIFFLVATTFQRTEREIAVALPRTAPAGPISDALREVVINVRADGTVVAGGRTLDEAELDRLLRDAVSKGPDRAVHVRGDRAATYEAVARVLAICKAAGIDDPRLDTEPIR